MTKNKKAIEKLNRVIETWEQGKKYRGLKMNNITLADVRLAEAIFDELNLTGQTKTIFRDMKDLLEFCGFTVQKLEWENGWRAF